MTSIAGHVILETVQTLLSILLSLSLSVASAASGSVTVNPSTIDSDGDGLADLQEDSNGNGKVDEGETDPLNADMDSGGEADGSEIQANRDPFDRKDDFTYDLDSDGLINGSEWELGTDPANPDTDGDGINDFDDPFPLDPAYRRDADKDGIPDEYEAAHKLSTTDATEATQDNDDDGLVNLDEFIQGTDPNVADTDGDGVTDGEEVTQGTDPEENACLLYAKPLVSFSDIADHWAQEYILRLHKTKVLPEYVRIADGYGEGSVREFLPDRSISRFELLKLALLGSCLPLDTETTGTGVTILFSDVPTIARPRESAAHRQRRRVVYTAARMQIVEGYDDSTFRPDDPVNRAEALKMLLLAAGIPASGEQTIETSFTDVPADAWFKSYVDEGVELGVIEGYEDSTFRPDQPITRAEAAKIVQLLMVLNPRLNGYVIPTEGI